MRRISAPLLLVVALGLAGLLTAVRLLPEALDLTRDDIAMDRAAALVAAERLADLEEWRPAGGDRRFAATYAEENPGARSFVELERGGSEAFLALVDSGVYVPSRWTVRMFAPDSISEVWIEFTPEGWPLGFGRTFADDDPGSGNLDAAEAEALARATAAEWDVALEDFELVEASSEEAPSGRVDHSIVFRRTGVDLGEGELRLAVRIAGSEPAGVYHSLEVPESFALRYRDLRTGNDGIALVSSALFLVLFMILGGGGGILYLSRRRMLVARPAFVLGGVVGLGLALTTINGLPLAWMGYDTAVSPRLFATQTIGGGLLIGAVAAGLLGVLYMAAESMTRAAFPRQLQQWRLWSKDAARSDEVLGLTVLGYALAGLHLGYITLFSLWTSRLEGWWSPASNVIQPDLIATYQPWLLAVATNLFAATWEESVFRAIPLAGAALLGARFGRRGWWIGGAMVLQALVFAAGHANYPQQPSYARVVELIAPALVWGFVYLRVGLFPTILAHFLYNLHLTAIPLFQMSAAGIRVDRAVILGVAAIPLLIVIRARVRWGAAVEAPDGLRNGAWSPAEEDASRSHAAPPSTVEPGPMGAAGPAAPEEPPAPVASRRPALRLPVPDAFVLPIGVLLLGVAWVIGERAELPPATTRRAQAIEIASTEMRARGHEPDAWDAFAEFTSAGGQSYQWVFEELGADAYDRLLGTWLAAPRWRVLFADFQRGAEERVETFTVVVEADGRPGGVTHALPESRPGAELDEADARAVAESYLGDVLALDLAAFEEIAAQQEALPARRDWTFGFRPRGLLPDSAGEARLDVTLAGDEVVSVRRRVEPPETWVREQQRQARVAVVAAVPVMLLVLGVGSFLLVVAVRMWARGELPLRPTLVFSAVLLPLLAATFANGIPAVVATFDPVLGWPIQFWGWVFAGVLMSTLGAVAVGLAVGVSRRWLEGASAEGRRPGPVGDRGAFGLGVLVVALVQILGAVVEAVFGDPGRPGRSFEGIDHWFPAATTSLGAVAGLVGLFAALSFLGAVFRRSAESDRIRFAFNVGVGMAAATAAATSWSESPLRALIGAVGVLAVIHVYAWIVARAPRSALGAAVAMTVLGLLAAIADPSYPGHALGGWIGLALAGLIAAWIARAAFQPLETPPAGSGAGV